MEPKQQFSIWYFVAVVLIVIAFQNFYVQRHVETLAYSEFKSTVKAGKVIEATVNEATVTGKLSPDARDRILWPGTVSESQGAGKGPHGFATVRVDDPGLIQDLEAAKERFYGQVENKLLASILSWIAPAAAQERVRATLLERRGALEALAKLLPETAVVDGASLRELLAEHSQEKRLVRKRPKAKRLDFWKTA